jgi:flagella basal body P-ring formation protein FlgA
MIKETVMTKYIPLHMIGSLAKIIVAVVLMILSVAFFIGSINQAMAAELQSSITVTGDNITLGDVYAGVEENADFVLAPAPLPGVNLVWNARTINRIAKAFDLPAANATDQISIRRLANIITKDMIEKEILAHLKADGLSDKMELDFLNADQARIILPHDVEPSLNVIHASYNPSRRTFLATLKTADDATHMLRGITHPLVDVPVLKLSARRGETIGRNDVTTIAMRQDYVTDDMIIQKDALIGMTPRKILRAKAPVSYDELEKPTLVKRGELVTMQLQRGPIQLSSLAKALEAGTQGDIIRLLNIDSKRTIEAEVTGPRTARVRF